MVSIKGSFTKFYEKSNPAHVYPKEWVVRTLSGKYPLLRLKRGEFAGSRILDIGFGDGRNWLLLHNIGFDIYGIEITDKIISLGNARAEKLRIPATLKVGTNASIPYRNSFFDYLLACDSCFYVDRGTTFHDNLKEYCRVLKPGGYLIASLPETKLYIFDGCIKQRGGYAEIHHDPFNLRNGCILKYFRNEKDIKKAFSAYFDSFSIGLCRDNFYGLQVNMFLLVCRKK